MKILMKVSGSISAYKICDVVSQLVQRGHDVRVCASNNALKFVGAATWEGLTKHKVFTDDFEPGMRMRHIDLNKWADIVVLSPATAKSLNNMASGVGDSVLTTLFLARDENKPYIIFPSMNPKMWSNESVQKSIHSLNSHKSMYLQIPKQGSMACGDYGVGRLWEPYDIIKFILQFESKSKSALVTLGGTTESIDGVRNISNFSTGTTGKSIIKTLSKKFNVTALTSQGIEPLIEAKNQIMFNSSDDLEKAILEEIAQKNYDLIVHLAAVSDFVPDKIRNKKISSEESKLTMTFKKRTKILNMIKGFSKDKGVKIVSFKLTHNEENSTISEKIKKQFTESDSDLIIQNSLNSSRGHVHEFNAWAKDKSEPVYKGSSKSDLNKLFESIEDIIKC